MDIIIKIVLACLMVWILLSPLLLIYLFFGKKQNTRLNCFCNNYSGALITGTIITFTTVIGLGLSHLLFFIPDSWGYITYDGNYLSWRNLISYLFALLASIGIVFVLEGYNSYKKGNSELERKIVVNYYLGKLHYATKAKRKKMLAKYKDKIEEFKESKYLLPEDQKMRRVFEDVVSSWEGGEEWGYDPWVGSSLGKDFDWDEAEE